MKPFDYDYITEKIGRLVYNCEMIPLLNFLKTECESDITFEIKGASCDCAKLKFQEVIEVGEENLKLKTLELTIPQEKLAFLYRVKEPKMVANFGFLMRFELESSFIQEEEWLYFIKFFEVAPRGEIGLVLYALEKPALVAKKPKVFCISGKAGAGKDYAADYMKTCLFAQDKQATILRNADLIKYFATTFFGWDGEKDVAGRALLQKIGTDIVRQKDDDYWVSFLEDVVSKIFEDYDYIIIPDVRYENETSYWKKKGYEVTTILVESTSYKSGPGINEQTSQHSSENHPWFSDKKRFDVILKNDFKPYAFAREIRNKIKF